ncbi:MAG: hypothetical protein ACOVK6_02425, partial [Ramlibacter sp.]
MPRTLRVLGRRGNRRKRKTRAKKKARRQAGFPQGREVQPPWNFTTSGTISSATMLMILISG